MKVLNFGSLNIDHVYQVAHIAVPGETITSGKYQLFCGGKGLNQSIAMSKAGLEIYHAGMIGEDGAELLEECKKYEIHTEHIRISPVRTGNAIIQVGEDGQNCIVLFPGANREITKPFVDEVLCFFDKGDFIILQNEISQLDYIINKAYEKEMKIVLNPSPFDDKIHACDLQKISYFFINEIEGCQLTGAKKPDEILDAVLTLFPESRTILTLGEAGSMYGDKEIRLKQAAFPVRAVDTTAAGDAFTGYFLSALLQKKEKKECLRWAAMASSIAVSREGAAKSIPLPEEVVQALKQNEKGGGK